MRTLLEQTSDIQPTPVDPEALRNCDSEREFVRLAYNLLRETSLWIAVFSCLLPERRAGWTRDEAIIAGQLVRLAKCARGVLSEASSGTHDWLFQFLRQGAEAIISFRYLLQFRST